MYIRQVIGSIIAGCLAAFLSFGVGFELVTAVAVGILIALGIRWIWATFGRTRYWLDRGTNGVYQEECPNCHSRRYRVGGDWILTCHRCGWKPGWPVIRWLTRSVPAIQFRRSVSRIEAVVAFVGAVVLGLSLSDSIPVLPSFEEILIAAGIAIVALALLLWGLFFRKTYCRNCGQYLGRGKPPGNCPRCGSNRFSHQDPGVGKKVRVEQMNEK